MPKKFYVTTPIFYANASPHMGHAYAIVLADMIARFHREKGEDVYFLTGTDEHGIKNLRSSENAGKDVIQFLDEQAEKFRALAESLGSSHDQFIRTTDKKIHYPGATAMWEKLSTSGDIYKGEYEGLYCVGCENFKMEKDLVDGKCQDHNTEPERIRQENYFFRLSKYADCIKEAIEKGELSVIPESRKNEILSMLEGGLEDVSFSRPVKDLPLGIPVPGDPTQTMYVWCDALTNYISALGYGSGDDQNLKKFWPADLHVIGKDILRFHAALWPGMLLSAGLALPKEILVHGLIMSDGRKMSKTIGNVIDPKDYLETYGMDAFRFYLAHEINPFEDGDFTDEKFKEAYNAYLVNGIGNLASRIMKMASSYLLEPVRINEEIKIPGYLEAFERHDIFSAIHAVSDFSAELDRIITEKTPFKLYKTDPEKAREIVSELVSSLASIARAIRPIMPTSAFVIESAIKENTALPPLFPRK